MIYHRMERLKQLLPLRDHTQFEEVSEILLNRVQLVINNHRYGLVEIEFYLCNDDHPDVFCHQFQDQKTNLQWYFHKSTESKPHCYKGGNYKGLDLTCGSQHSYGGILIRSIQSLDSPSNAIIEGPCCCVNKILELCQCNQILNLVSNTNFTTDVVNCGLLRLESRPAPYVSLMPVFRSPRVGLTLKKSDQSDARQKYLLKPYRYLTRPGRISKYKKLTTLIAIAERTPSLIQPHFGLKSTRVDELRREIITLQAKNTTIDQFQGQDLTDSQRAELYFAGSQTSQQIPSPVSKT